MKTKNVFKALAAMALVGVFASCSSDDTTSVIDQQFAISIAKNAEFQVTSGGRTLMKSSATRAGLEDALLYFKAADCPDLYKANFPAQKLYKEECDYVYACIKEDAELLAAGQPAKYEKDKSILTDKAYYIVNAYSAKDHDAKGDHSDVAGDMHDLAINGVYIKEFNTNVNVCADLILPIGGIQKVTYDDSFGVKKESYTVDDWKLFQIPGDEYGYYIGMDYHSAKEDLHGDGEFSDWVIKLIPAEAKADPVDETNGSAEINLSVNDEHENGDFIATKLSIHLRALTDAEIFIPVEKQYYCEADDMDISFSHKLENVIYNTQPQYVETTVGTTKVTFKVAYEDEGIRITTDGVDKSVIDFCAQEYADGITFEVWNYFKDITREDLKVKLDKATVQFLDYTPAVYVNAFAKIPDCPYATIYSKFNEAGQLVPYVDEELTKPLEQKYWTRETEDSKDYIFTGMMNPWDCTVSPTGATFTKNAQDENNPNLPNYNVVYTLAK